METETLLEPKETEKVDVEAKEPNMWFVILHNDNVTTMDFVIMILIKLFHKSAEEAAEIMLQIHNKGKAVAGRYPFEIAEEKMNTVLRTASAYGFPLQATIEEDTGNA